MEKLRAYVAAFCAACIAAKLLSSLVGKWGQSCIKAVAGLYILLVVLRGTPQLSWKMPDTSDFFSKSAGNADSFARSAADEELLAETERQLAEQLEAVLNQRFQKRINLKIRLTEKERTVYTERIEAEPLQPLTPDEVKALTEYLQEQLGFEKIDIILKTE